LLYNIIFLNKVVIETQTHSISRTVKSTLYCMVDYIESTIQAVYFDLVTF